MFKNNVVLVHCRRSIIERCDAGDARIIDGRFRCVKEREWVYIHRHAMVDATAITQIALSSLHQVHFRSRYRLFINFQIAGVRSKGSW